MKNKLTTFRYYKPEVSSKRGINKMRFTKLTQLEQSSPGLKKRQRQKQLPKEEEESPISGFLVSNPVTKDLEIVTTMELL